MNALVGTVEGGGPGRPTTALGTAERLACMPILVLAGVVGALYAVRSQAFYEPRLLLPILDLIFSTVVSLVVAGLAASSFVANRLRAGLLLGSGILAFGAASALSDIGIPGGEYNESIAVYDIGACLAGLCNFLGALYVVTSGGGRTVRRPWRALALGYGGVLMVVLAVAAAVYANLLPGFFVEGQGPTALRQVVLWMAIAQFAAASGLLGLAARRQRSRFLCWYSLGLDLFALGLCGSVGMTHFGSALGWIGRGCIHLGGVYLLAAVVIAVRQSHNWTIPLGALRETHQRYTSLVDLCPDAILVHSEGRCVFANPAAARLFGADSPERLIGLGVMDLVHPDWRGAVEERVRRVLAEGGPAAVEEVRLLRVDGTPIDAEGTGARVEYEGRPAIQVVLRDVSERKRAEAALREAKAAAEQANAAKDQFLAVLSHELRTPLSPVLMTASAYEHEERAPAETREDMALIRRSVELEVQLIDDLLDFSRVGWGKLHLELRPLDAHEELKAAVDVCRPEADGRRIGLKCELLAESSWVRGDGTRLQQVFWNLLKNAIKFTPAGGSIDVRSGNSEGGALRIQVADSGIGIAPEALPRLFNPFVQADSHVTREYGGLGLGLAISKSLLEKHGGSIRAESEGLGKGATLTVELPTVEARPEAGGEPEAPPPTADATPAAGGLRVLLVEDHELTANLISRVLVKQGYRVRRAGTVAGGLGLLASEEFDLLVCDLGLPDGSGHDLMRQARAMRPDLRALALSGYGMDADRQKSREAGFLEHLTKPIDLNTLRSAVARTASQPGPAPGGQQ